MQPQKEKIEPKYEVVPSGILQRQWPNSGTLHSPSSKRLLIEDALRLHRRLWFIQHPSFRTPECQFFTEETLTREHVRAFAELLGIESDSWNSFSEAELRIYISALRVECARFEIDLLERIGEIEILPFSPEVIPQNRP